MKNSEVFARAAEIIKVRGHCKGILHDGEGRVCARGALGVVLTDNPTMIFGISEFDAILAKAIYGEDAAADLTITRNSVPEWNNAPERTAEEVIAMFEAVAATEKAKESAHESPAFDLPSSGRSRHAPGGLGGGRDANVVQPTAATSSPRSTVEVL